MATSLYKAQAALRLCDQHDQKELNYYCRTCGKTICTKCVKSEHNSHDWELISEYLKERRRQLPTECGDLQSKELVDLQQKIDRFETKLRENKKELERNECLIENERKNVMGCINQFFNEELDKCRQFTDDKNTIIEKERDELKKKQDYLKMITNSLKSDISTFSDHDVIEMEGQMKAELESAEKSHAEKHIIGCSLFIPGDLQAISSKLGKAHTFFLEEISSCATLTSVVGTIAPVPFQRTAWVSGADDKEYTLLSEKGQKLKTLTYIGGGLVVTSNGLLIIQNQSVTILDGTENVKDSIGFAPLNPMCLELTREGDILISLTDGGDKFELDSSSRRLVRHMTLSGKTLHTYEFKDKSRTRLFKCPRRMAENANTDICVINRISSEKAELIVLEREGQMKFCFKGTGEFDPWDVVCDNKCRILLAEANSQSIIVLDSEGVQLSILHTFVDAPLTMALKDGRLWCGFSEGSITVYKYK